MLISRCLGLLMALAALPASASLTVLVGEPFGSFGTMMPNGHVTIYLDRVCADGPTRLRMCQPGEAQGVAIARLNAIGPIDWIASPILQFLYATDQPQSILTYATPRSLAALQDRYRERNLLTLYPDGTEKKKPNDEWWETVGVAYVRRLWGYQVDTTQAQDEAFVASMNQQANRRNYHLHGRNCADFGADAVNFYFPGTVKVNRYADLDLMTPKQVARSLSNYAANHPETHLRVFEIPQLPGSFRRSRPVLGAAESLLKIKRYLVTLLILQPEAVAALWITYMERGRWHLGQDGVAQTPAQMIAETMRSLNPNLAASASAAPTPER